MTTILILVFEFFKTGLFAVGGGLATIPFLQEMGINHGWFSVDVLSTMIAVSQSTPGPIGINMATYVGYQTASFLGGLVTTLSLVTPSIIIVCFIASKYDSFKNSKRIQAVFVGLRPAVVGFILAACMGIFTSTLLNVEISEVVIEIKNAFNIISIVFVAILLVINHFRKLNPIITIIICGCLGLLLEL